MGHSFLERLFRLGEVVLAELNRRQRSRGLQVVGKLAQRFLQELHRLLGLFQFQVGDRQSIEDFRLRRILVGAGHT